MAVAPVAAGTTALSPAGRGVRPLGQRSRGGRVGRGDRGRPDHARLAAHDQPSPTAHRLTVDAAARRLPRQGPPRPRARGHRPRRRRAFRRRRRPVGRGPWPGRRHPRRQRALLGPHPPLDRDRRRPRIRLAPLRPRPPDPGPPRRRRRLRHADRVAPHGRRPRTRPDELLRRPPDRRGQRPVGGGPVGLAPVVRHPRRQLQLAVAVHGDLVAESLDGAGGRPAPANKGDVPTGPDVRRAGRRRQSVDHPVRAGAAARGLFG